MFRASSKLHETLREWEVTICPSASLAWIFNTFLSALFRAASSTSPVTYRTKLCHATSRNEEIQRIISRGNGRMSSEVVPLRWNCQFVILFANKFSLFTLLFAHFSLSFLPLLINWRKPAPIFSQAFFARFAAIKPSRRIDYRKRASHPRPPSKDSQQHLLRTDGIPLTATPLPWTKGYNGYDRFNNRLPIFSRT